MIVKRLCTGFTIAHGSTTLSLREQSTEDIVSDLRMGYRMYKTFSNYP